MDYVIATFSSLATVIVFTIIVDSIVIWRWVRRAQRSIFAHLTDKIIEGFAKVRPMRIRSFEFDDETTLVLLFLAIFFFLPLFLSIGKSSAEDAFSPLLMFWGFVVYFLHREILRRLAHWLLVRRLKDGIHSFADCSGISFITATATEFTQEQVNQMIFEKGKEPILPWGLEISENRAYTWQENEKGIKKRRFVKSDAEWSEKWID